MAFGVTEDGFSAKRVEDIKSELEASFRTVFGSGINLDARGPFGQLIGIISEREGSIWELAESVYNNFSPQNAKGIGVDNALSYAGLVRRVATASTATMRFFGAVGTVIPINTQVSRSDDSTVIFDTLSNTATILVGTGVDEVQLVSFSAVPDAGSFTLDFDGQITAAINFNDNAAAVQAALEALSNVGAGNVLVAGNFTSGFTITFQAALGQDGQVQIALNSNSLTLAAAAVTVTPTTTTEGALPSVDIEGTCTQTGPIDAPAGTLDTLDTGPIVGFDSVTNPTDATLGLAKETDAEAKQRRNESIANPGNATLVAIRSKLLQVSGVVAVNMFENTSLITDSAGRPAKSYEAVIQGGVDTDLADVMWETKPAGIQQVGTTLVIIKDSQLFDREIRFSRPTSVPIYVEMLLTVDATFPVDGLTQAEEAILAYGNGLNISDDVVVIPQMICSLNGISGILDIQTKVSAAPIPADATVDILDPFVNDGGFLKATFAAPHGLVVGNRVQLVTAGGTLPTGVADGGVYWVIAVPAATEFIFSETRTGAGVPFIDGGVGLNRAIIGGREDNIEINDDERAEFDSSRITVT